MPHRHALDVGDRVPRSRIEPTDHDAEIASPRAREIRGRGGVRLGKGLAGRGGIREERVENEDTVMKNQALIEIEADV